MSHPDPFAIQSKDTSFQEQILNFINYFGLPGGFDCMFDLISWE